MFQRNIFNVESDDIQEPKRQKTGAISILDINSDQQDESVYRKFEELLSIPTGLLGHFSLYNHETTNIVRPELPKDDDTDDDFEVVSLGDTPPSEATYNVSSNNTQTPTISTVSTYSFDNIPDALKLYKVKTGEELKPHEYNQIHMHKYSKVVLYFQDLALRYIHHTDNVCSITGNLIRPNDSAMVNKYAITAKSYRVGLREKVLDKSNYYGYLEIAFEKYQTHLKAIVIAFNSHKDYVGPNFYIPDALKLINPFTNNEMAFSEYAEVISNGNYCFRGRSVTHLYSVGKVSVISGQITSDNLGRNYTCNAKSYRNKIYGEEKPSTYMALIRKANALYLENVAQLTNDSADELQQDHSPRLR